MYENCWPTAELESGLSCPACTNPERKILLRGLIDNVFFVAPGEWTLYRCTQCSSAYLDPRPTFESIGRAYTNYYTHDAVAPSTAVPFEKLGILRRLRRKLSNGYLNHRYGTKRQPSSKAGAILAKIFPGLRRGLDFEFRFLPKPNKGDHLLDIGCGNGRLIVGLLEAGWQISGVELDPIAAKVARSIGIDVTQGTIESLKEESDKYDAITLSHVIEHVHDPRKLLQDVYRLLKPNGVVYIETPNIDSHWAKLFRENWRGLESPRHLILFTPRSLIDLLLTTGFSNIKTERRVDPQKHMYVSSKELTVRYSIELPKSIDLSLNEKLNIFISSFGKKKHLEFITLIAKK